MGLARDWSNYTSPVLPKEGALQDIACSEVQEAACVEIYQNDADRAKPLEKFSSDQELKRKEAISMGYGQQPYGENLW